CFISAMNEMCSRNWHHWTQFAGGGCVGNACGRARLGLTGFGESANGPFVERSHIFQVLDNVSIVHRNHSVKFGGEFQRIRFNELGNAYARGGLSFEDKATSNPAQRNSTIPLPISCLVRSEMRSAYWDFRAHCFGIPNSRFILTISGKSRRG